MRVSYFLNYTYIDLTGAQIHSGGQKTSRILIMVHFTGI